jgi:hypothetical protein
VEAVVSLAAATRVRAHVAWRRADDNQPFPSIIDGGSVTFEKQPNYGMLPSEVDEFWMASGTLTAGNSLDLDLSSLSFTRFGSSLSVAFGKVKYILVVNFSTGASAILQVGACPSDPIGGIFGDAASDLMRVPPDSAWFWSNSISGVAVSGSSNTLRLRAVTDAVQYGIAVVGDTTAFDLPAMPEAEDEPNFLYGDNGPYDVGVCGLASYAVADTKWKYAMAIAWYGFYQETNGLSGCGMVVNDISTGLPSAVGIYQGTVSRLKAEQPNALVGFYLTLGQIADTTGQKLLATSTWPRSRPIWDAEWTALGANGWNDSDIGTHGKWIDSAGGLPSATVRELSATKNAEVVQLAKEQNPDINLVFSDNFSSLVDSTVWGYECDLASRFVEKITPLGVAFIPNVTSAGMRGASINGTDMDSYWDLLAAAGVAGIYQEGITHTHAMRTTLFDQNCANITNWISRSWTGGGNLALLCHAVTSLDTHATQIFYGSARRVDVVDVVAISPTVLEFETGTPHFLEDTSHPTCVFQAVHAAINGPEYQTSVEDSVTFRVTFSSAHGVSSFTPGAGSYVHFPHAGYDTDFGLMHALRAAGDCTLNWWNPSAIYGDPLWYGDITEFGVVVPASLEAIDWEDVTDSNGTTLECVKEIKYQFAQGDAGERWHHVRFDQKGRRRWKAAA